MGDSVVLSVDCQSKNRSSNTHQGRGQGFKMSARPVLLSQLSYDEYTDTLLVGR